VELVAIVQDLQQLCSQSALEPQSELLNALSRTQSKYDHVDAHYDAPAILHSVFHVCLGVRMSLTSRWGRID
jgi:hypothetical protein